MKQAGWKIEALSDVFHMSQCYRLHSCMLLGLRERVEHPGPARRQSFMNMCEAWGYTLMSSSMPCVEGLAEPFRVILKTSIPGAVAPDDGTGIGKQLERVVRNHAVVDAGRGEAMPGRHQDGEAATETEADDADPAGCPRLPL